MNHTIGERNGIEGAILPATMANLSHRHHIPYSLDGKVHTGTPYVVLLLYDSHRR
jgi:hypothetical protein